MVMIVEIIVSNQKLCVIDIYIIKIGTNPHKRCLLLVPFSTRRMQETIVVFTMCCVENKLF